MPPSANVDTGGGGGGCARMHVEKLVGVEENP